MCVCELVGPVCVCVCALQFVVTIFVAYFSGHFTLNNKPKVFNGKGDGYERRFGGLLCVTRCVWRTQAHTRTHSQTHTHTKNRHETQRGALGVYAIVAGCGHIKYTPWLTRAFAQLKKKKLNRILGVKKKMISQANSRDHAAFTHLTHTLAVFLYATLYLFFLIRQCSQMSSWFFWTFVFSCWLAAVFSYSSSCCLSLLFDYFGFLGHTHGKKTMQKKGAWFEEGELM